MRMVKAGRVLGLAAVAALAMPGASLAAAHGTAQAHAPRHAAARHHVTKPTDLKWVQVAMAEASAKARHATIKPRATVGNFAQCPRLPAKADPSAFVCGLIHITGGVLDLGGSHQVINREINISFAESSDAAGNTVLVQGTLKSAPMPVAGGIFETPEVDKATKADKNLQLQVQPIGVSEALDPTGQASLITSQRIKAINPVFGKNCFVGTKAAPVVLAPTEGTTNPPPPNQPESGHIDAIEQVGKELVIIGTVVDNAFAAPPATGCGPSGALNRVVNAVAGLPSAAGTNNAVFQATIEAVNYNDV
jgi:hypothetical protein